MITGIDRNAKAAGPTESEVHSVASLALEVEMLVDRLDAELPTGTVSADLVERLHQLRDRAERILASPDGPR
jgi:hypothetical protein